MIPCICSHVRALPLQIQILGENTYHSACLRREILKHSGQSLEPLFCRALSFLDNEATPADAAEQLPEKLSLSGVFREVMVMIENTYLPHFSSGQIKA